MRLRGRVPPDLPAAVLLRQHGLDAVQWDDVWRLLHGRGVPAARVRWSSWQSETTGRSAATASRAGTPASLPTRNATSVKVLRPAARTPTAAATAAPRPRCASPHAIAATLLQAAAAWEAAATAATTTIARSMDEVMTMQTAHTTVPHTQPSQSDLCPYEMPSGIPKSGQSTEHRGSLMVPSCFSRCEQTQRTEDCLLDLVEHQTNGGEYGSTRMLSAVQHFVRSILRGELSLYGVSIRSYRHKNGFLKIVLAEGAGRKLRFHSYLPGEGDENIHDHRWAVMHSMVLDGALPAQYLSIAEPDEEGAARYVDHHYAKVGSDYRVAQRGESFLKVDEEVVHESGTTYAMTSRQLHRILRTEASVATLVFTEPVPVERPWCHLYASHPICECSMDVVHEERLSSGDLLSALHALDRHLSRTLRARTMPCGSIERKAGVA